MSLGGCPPIYTCRRTASRDRALYFLYKNRAKKPGVFGFPDDCVRVFETKMASRRPGLWRSPEPTHAAALRLRHPHTPLAAPILQGLATPVLQWVSPPRPTSRRASSPSKHPPYIRVGGLLPGIRLYIFSTKIVPKTSCFSVSRRLCSGIGKKKGAAASGAPALARADARRDTASPTPARAARGTPSPGLERPFAAVTKRSARRESRFRDRLYF